MTCPCHQADYIGETSLSLAERLLYHQEHGNRIVQEVLLGKKNVTRIRPELKSFETLVKDDMKLYQHSANCPAAIQWFLDENPAYWPFVPIKISEAEEFDEEREVAHSSLEDTTQFTYANDIPAPPSGYRFTNFLIGTLVAERLRNDRDPDPYIPDYEKKLYAHSTQCSVPLQLFLKCHPEYWCFVPMTNEQVLIDNARVSPLEINLLNDYQNSLFTATQTSQYTRDMTLVQWCVNHVPSPPLNYQFSIRQKIQQYEFFSTKSDIYVTRFLDLYNPAIVLALPENASDALRRTVQALLVVYAEPKLVDTTVTHSETALQSTDIIEPTIWCQHLKLRLNSISKMAASDKDTMTTIDLTNNFNDVEWFDAVFDILDEEGDEDRDDILEEYNEDFDFDIRNKIFNEDMIECVEPKFMMANMDPDRKIRYEEIIPQKFKQILTNNEEPQRNVEENPLTSDENQEKSIPSPQSMPSKPLRSWDDDYVDSEQEEEEEEDNYPISNYDERLNEMFEKVMLDHLSGTTTMVSIQMLRELAMLQHEVAKIKLEKKLWNIYLKAGTGQWDTPESLKTNVDRGVWPIPIQNMIKFRLSESKTSVMKNEGELGQIIVCEHLQVLDEKLQHILATYNTKKAQSIGVTDETEKRIKNFITRYSLVSYQMKLNYELAILLYDYDDQLLERTYLQMKPTDYQDPILSTSPQGMRAATISSSQELRKNSYHPKIETFLSRWRQLQEEKNQCQKQQEQNIQQLDQKPQEQWQRDDFDRLIEEDLENQLKELERQEDEQYRLLEQSLEEELKTEQCSVSIQPFQHDFSKELHHMAILIQSEQNEQQQQYDTVLKALEKYKQYDILKKFETDFHLYTKIRSEEMHTSQKFSQLFTSANEQQKKKDEPTRRNPTVSYSELNLRQLIGLDIDKVPQYLNHTNDSFHKIIHSIRPTMTVNRLEELRHIAILMYKLFLLEKLELLWTMYRRSGTGNLELSTPIEQMNRNIWPKEVRTRIELIHNKYISNNDLYLTFVEHCLGKLYEKNEECQRQLRYRTGHLVDYTWAMEETIKKFVQQGFMYQSVEYACQIALVQYNYREAMAKQQFLHENPNQNQVSYIVVNHCS
ncbi:unnamed protein product [Rotaria sp. Silwood1]|nr:unnamed protein product [Rotaria sp. Silwood1]